ncbi:MAG: 3-hydroxyacyl-CoA dehydrogenase/enoyl-CoA hydratase family protein [Candidatus Eremiobacterota bacterium]
MPLSIRHAAVIGAGTMGAGIAAQLANAGIPTLLLDVPGDGDRNGPARKGLERVLKGKPAALMLPERASLISVGNTEDDLARVKEADWIVEAVFENLDVKRSLWERVEPLAGSQAILSSNSSGIPMSLQAKGRSESFRRRFLGSHFFNPPRYLHLLELIPTPDTDRHTLDVLADFGDQVLGKGVVVARDVPGFAANRIGLYGVVLASRAMVELGLTPDVVDFLTGPLIGRPKSATFRTMDLSGLDICYQVAVDLTRATGEDFALPDFFARLVLEKKWLGDKTGHGFFKKVKGEDGASRILTLNLDTFEYEDRGKVRLEEVGPILKLPTVEERVQALMKLEGPIGEFIRRIHCQLFAYAASKVGEVAETAREVDNAMKWGFGWQVGPLELAARLENLEESFTRVGIPMPQSLRNGAKTAAAGPILLRELRERVVVENPDASLIDLGDGVACLEFHSKANSIGAGVLEMFEAAHQEVERNFQGLVVANQGENFCAGADLTMLLRLASGAQWDEIDQAVRIFQGMTTKLRTCPYPVVVAPFRLNIGGGCEVALWADACQASAELYTGLVEVGVGIIPGGGGTTEMLIRMLDRVPPGGDPFPAVRQAFELIALAKVSGSALEARELGFLLDRDDITMNQDRIIDEAKRRVLDMVPGYTPPPRRTVKALGETAYANLRLGAYMMNQAGHITDFELHLAATLANVLTGGRMNRLDEVDEQVILDLEREAILHLVGHEKTRQRMEHTLKTGKTLRN